MLTDTLDFNLLEKCFLCGACYDVCPSCLSIPGYDPREVIKDILSGNFERWTDSPSIYQCLECHQCLELCFQHYGFENAMTAMRHYATIKGVRPQEVKKGWDMFIKTSKLGEPQMPARKKLDLPEPKTSGKDEFLKMLDAYRNIKKG